MKIDISKTEQDQLARHALAAGYSDVAAYVTEYVIALAHQPGDLEKLTPQALENSLETCDQSMAQFDRGEDVSSAAARDQSLSKLRRRS